jgi:general secretion pathway protein C
VLHLTMIAVGAYFMADMANVVVGSRLEAAIEVPRRGDLPMKGASPAALKGNADYEAIVEGNIFNSKLRGKRPEPEAFQSEAPEMSAAPKVPLNMTLIGTAVGQGGASYAIIEDAKTKEQLLYRVGDLLLDDAKIARISRNKVEILRGNEKEVLEVSLTQEETKPGTQPATSTPVAPKGTASSVRQVSRNRWVLDKREVESAVDNLPQLLTKARIIPNFSNGKPDGFRIFAIMEDSLYSKIGLQNGDILHRVNGIEVRDPQNFLKVFEQLKDETSITVDLVRNNQKETFGYEIR